MPEDCCSFLEYRQKLSEVRCGGLRERRSRGIARRLLELSGIQAGIVGSPARRIERKKEWGD